MTQSTNLMTDIDKRFDAAAVGFPPVRYISGDEMAYLRARAVALRAETGRAVFARILGLFRSRPAAWISGPALTAK